MNEERESPPKVIVVNGVPCSGKSSLTTSFQGLRAAAGELWLHVQLDAFDAMLPEKGALPIEKYVRAGGAMVAALASMPRPHVNLAIELVLRPTDAGAAAIQRELLGALVPFNPVMVAVVVSPATALAREATRAKARQGIVSRDLQLVNTDYHDLAISTDERLSRGS